MPSREEALAAVRTLIDYIGDDPDRPGLIDTPDRVLRAWEQDWGRGYRVKTAEELIRIFPAEAGRDITFSQMITVKNIAIFSHCEHHMTPFFGHAHISYIPAEIGLIGLSKLARVADYFSRQLQVQERLTENIADYLEAQLSSAVGVMLECQHMCMISRGIQQPGTLTTTTALRGEFLYDVSTKQEFLRACQA